jgi:nicotinamide/nicotinate riboside kinase
MEQWLIIGISGVTCSGKTTLADSLYKHFKERNGQEIKPGIELNRVELLNQDDYFRSVDDPNHQKVERLNHLNWEIIESIDMNKMIRDIMETLGSKFVLYNTRSSSLVNSLDHGNLFQNHYNLNQHHPKPRIARDSDELMLDEEETCNFKKIVKHNNLLNILIVEGLLVFNHSVTFDLFNVKFHLHVPYEVCYARRSKRTYDPPDVPCKFIMRFSLA